METKHVIVHVYGRDTDDVASGAHISRRLGELLPDADVHYVVQGPAVEGLTVAGTRRLGIDTVLDGVQVHACAHSMKTAGLDPAELRDGVTTVPAAAVYLAERQWEGWAYIRI
ncbi:hypothetical protein ACFPJ4_12670 [Lysinimonas soli]|uniref:DsrE family protein n=1 Tax=Lysinimonas soli TaxID=1074233 RepID=A0ABW0NSN9_9MICO